MQERSKTAYKSDLAACPLLEIGFAETGFGVWKIKEPYGTYDAGDSIVLKRDGSVSFETEKGLPRVPQASEIAALGKILAENHDRYLKRFFRPIPEQAAANGSLEKPGSVICDVFVDELSGTAGISGYCVCRDRHRRYFQRGFMMSKKMRKEKDNMILYAIIYGVRTAVRCRQNELIICCSDPKAQALLEPSNAATNLEKFYSRFMLEMQKKHSLVYVFKRSGFRYDHAWLSRQAAQFDVH